MKDVPSAITASALFILKTVSIQYTEFFFFSRVNIENYIRKKEMFFENLAQNIDCGYTLEPPRRGGSNKYPQSMFWTENKKNI